MNSGIAGSAHSDEPCGSVQGRLPLNIVWGRYVATIYSIDRPQRTNRRRSPTCHGMGDPQKSAGRKSHGEFGGKSGGLVVGEFPKRKNDPSARGPVEALCAGNLARPCIQGRPDISYRSAGSQALESNTCCLLFRFPLCPCVCYYAISSYHNHM